MIFLDTNVLVYLFDRDAPSKQRRVRELLADRSLQERIILSTQKLHEFYVSVTRKLATPLGPDTAERAVLDFTAWLIVHIDPSLILSAIKRCGQLRFSF